MQQLGRYEVLEELGHGAMGTVYRARDPKIERVVAIKTVRVVGATPEQEAEYRRRFFREAQAAGKLSHPGIVTIYDAGEDEATQTPYIVMEYVEGRTLESLLTDPGLERPSLTASLELVKQVAEALDYAHTYSIVHRDIKPANIMVTAEGRAKITDFGIAKLRQSEFTVPGQILGTPAYLSPEQLKGTPLDGRADLFSLGVILYWMVTGQKPFAGDISTVLYQVACEEPPPVTQLKPVLAAELNPVVSRALAKDPASRYQRGKELADDLDDLLQGRIPRWASGSLPAADLDKTVVEARPVAVEKTIVERRGFVSETAQLPGGGLGPVLRDTSRVVAQSFRRLPAKARIAVAAGVLLLLFLPVLSREGTILNAILGPRETATLNVRSAHSFRSADVSVWVDDDLAYQGELTGVKKRRLFRSSVRGSFSASLLVPAGEQVVRVHVHSEREGYDQTQETTAEFLKDQEHTLVLGFSGRSRNLYLSWTE